MMSFHLSLPRLSREGLAIAVTHPIEFGEPKITNAVASGYSDLGNFEKKGPRLKPRAEPSDWGKVAGFAKLLLRYRRCAFIETCPAFRLIVCSTLLNIDRLILLED